MYVKMKKNNFSLSVSNIAQKRKMLEKNVELIEVLDPVHTLTCQYNIIMK